MGRAISVMSISAARWQREMVSLTHSFVAMISDSAELREVRRCWRNLQDIGPRH